MIDMAAPCPTRAPITAKRIIEIVSEHTDVDVKSMKSHSRFQHIVTARNIATLLIRHWRPDLSYPQIGRLFGGRDHSTIIHGHKSIIERIKRNPDLELLAHDAEMDVVYEAYFKPKTVVQEVLRSLNIDMSDEELSGRDQVIGYGW